MVDDLVSNRSGNTPFAEIAQARLSRRKVLGGGAATVAGFLGTHLVGSPVAAHTSGNGHSGSPSGLLGFKGVPLSDADEVVVAEGYTAKAFIPWGDPVVPGGPAWKGRDNTSAEQEQQIGYNHDGMFYFPIDDSSDHGVLCVNHEYTNEEFFHSESVTDWTLEETRKSQAAHGVSVVEIKRIDGEWTVVNDAGLNRRITVNTPMEFSGPVAGHDLLKTVDDPEGLYPIGTANNCGSGPTPWGTYITCEENFNGYFGSTEGEAWEATELQDRYGFAADGFGYRWHETDKRFDLSAEGYENEHLRFGWQVEIDPFDPDATPRKLTALGRFKHEGMAIGVGRANRVMAYMGDDERFDYFYKFVSDKPYHWYLRRGLSPFDDGILYVAQFYSNGKGTWLPLVHGNGPLTEENGFPDQATVLTYVRKAADLLGATPMDRPEWTTIAPDGYGYMTCTNNTRREEGDENAANPRADNKWGHIIRWYDSYQRAGVNFDWDIFVLAGPGDGVDGSTVSADAGFGSPDGIYADPNGRLWILTDGQQPDIEPDRPGNDQVLCADPETGEIRRFLTGVRGCEMTGCTVTPDGRTMFVNVQHPGNGDPSVSSFPGGEPGDIPRPATLVITKDDGGVIGT